MSRFMGIIGTSDEKVFYAINSRTRCTLFDVMMPLVTFLGGAVFTISFVLSIIMFGRSSIRVSGVICALSLSLSFIITHTIKRVVNRQRPWKKLSNVNVYDTKFRLYSFPSGHTTAAFSIGIALGLCFSGFYWIFLFLCSLVAFSRIYLGVHYPTDVIVGAVVGIVSAYLSYSWLCNLL